MKVWQSPGFDEALLERYGCLDDIYNALRSNDLSEVVVAALEALKRTGTLPIVKTEKKSETVSSSYRVQGNQAYTAKNYREALILYNKALKYAPEDSKAMKIAYSNRSALLMTIKAYPECLNDIETVFKMGCPYEIRSKLDQRLKDATSWMYLTNSYWSDIPPAANYYFKYLRVPPHPQISCANTLIDFRLKDGIPKIIAAKDVKVGMVLAVDTAFVSNLVPDNVNLACYYCHRLSYNLMPCDGCCHVLFCDEMCMNDSVEHGIECQIMDLIICLQCDESVRLAIKAAIKMSLSSLSWESLINGSKIYGLNRTRKSSVLQIFNETSLFSLLNWEDRRHFVHGKMYNASFVIAAVIHSLGLIPGFLPDSSERDEAIKCLGRIMMYLTLFGSPTVLVDAASVKDTLQIVNNKAYNFGLFSFVGKLKNSCMPNVLSVGLNNKVGLIAAQPIARGTELKIAYLGHWLESIEDSSKRPMTMFMLYGRVCNCIICSGDWKHKPSTVTAAQRACYEKQKGCDVSSYLNLMAIFKSQCKNLSILHNAPFSEEYKNLYATFRRCILFLQHIDTKNCILDSTSS